MQFERRKRTSRLRPAPARPSQPLRAHLGHSPAIAGISEADVRSIGVDAPHDPQLQTDPAVLGNQREDAQASPNVGLGLDDVEAPDVVVVKRQQPHAVNVLESKPTARPKLVRNREPLTTRDALNPVLASCQLSAGSSTLSWR